MSKEKEWVPPPGAYVSCRKCGYVFGDDWTQCRGKCSMEGSPHYVPDLKFKQFKPDVVKPLGKNEIPF